MTTDTTTDHAAATCPYSWCQAHAVCDCPFSNVQPHAAARCRYARATDDEDGGDGDAA